MNGVIGMVQLLLETDLTREQRRFANVVQTSGRALLSLIDNILDLSKIEARKIVLEKRNFQLGHVVEDVVQLLGVQAKAKGLAFRGRVLPNIPPMVYGDSLRLRQVLTNLAANAIKFTDRGAVTLEAALESQSANQITVRFRITDTGIGIKADQMAALFQPFAQADASTTRKYGGTGLGLTISKQLVEMMGGTIGVRSSYGEGSTFWFTTVLDQATAVQGLAAGDPADQAADAPCRTAPAGHDVRVLVAEDNAVNREVVLAQLHRLGYRASTVVNGAEAVEAARSGAYDLVLMDCEMPVMDGFEATRRIRESLRSSVPIVAVTADAMPADRDRCLHAGMNDYMAKPVELRRLAGLLAKWLPARADGAGVPVTLETSADAPKSVFNETALLQRLMGDRQLAGVVLKGFLADAPARLNSLRQRLEAADAAGTKLDAHALKGASATVAADNLQALAMAIEQAGNVGCLDRFAELLRSATEEFQRFKTTLESAGWAKQTAIKEISHDPS
jgi:CheY-like chemotaxis protein/HPt (histidine-containing phosphotransfer) domain-containing protein